MSATTAKNLLTAREFAKLPKPLDGSKQELVRGEVMTMPPPGFVHGVVQMNVGFALKAYAKQTKSGRVTVESGVITEEDPDTVRGPDVAFWTFKSLPPDQVPTVYPTVAADLCVEVTSPTSFNKDLSQKIQEYFARGVRLVRIVDAGSRTVEVYRDAINGRVFRDDATLTDDAVLPGFRCPVAEFFEIDG